MEPAPHNLASSLGDWAYSNPRSGDANCSNHISLPTWLTYISAARKPGHTQTEPVMTVGEQTNFGCCLPAVAVQPAACEL